MIKCVPISSWPASCAVLVAAVFLVGASVGNALAQSKQETTASQDRKTLRSVNLLLRHSVISPKYNPPKLKASWPMGYRQLTAIGISRTYATGEQLRKKYVEELGLIAPTYHVKEVYFRASNADRSLQTAQMLALGLYPLGTGANPSKYDASLKPAPRPDLAFTPVPIHSVSLRNDAVMRPWTGQANCQRYRQFLKALPKSKLYRAQGNKFSPFLTRIASITGMKEGKSPAQILYFVNEIYEPLTAIIAHKKKMTDKISDKDMELLGQLSDWNYHHQFLGKKIGRLTGGPLVGEMLNNFNGFIKDPKEARKLYVYSGHQRTILGFEAALGIETARTQGPLFKGRVPPLGSRYALELHEREPKKYSVRLKFVWGKSEKTIQIPGCSGGFCPIERFRRIAEKVVPKSYWGWRAQCRVKKAGFFGK